MGRLHLVHGENRKELPSIYSEASKKENINKKNKKIFGSGGRAPNIPAASASRVCRLITNEVFVPKPYQPRTKESREAGVVWWWNRRFPNFL